MVFACQFYLVGIAFVPIIILYALCFVLARMNVRLVHFCLSRVSKSSLCLLCFKLLTDEFNLNLLSNLVALKST